MERSLCVPLTYYDGVKAPGHEHGRVPGVEVEVARSQEGGQLPRWSLRVLQAAAAVCVVTPGLARPVLAGRLDGGGQLRMADHHPLIALHLRLHLENQNKGV